METARPSLKELDNYDVIQLTLTCVSGVDRKLMLEARKLKEIVARGGKIDFSSSTVPGDSLLYDWTSSVGDADVDVSSLCPMPWLSTNECKVGGAMCHIYPPMTNPNATFSPRAAAMKQIDLLRKEYGLTIKSAIEAELMIFEKDKTTPFNNVHFPPYGRYDAMAGRDDIMLDTCQSLVEAGLPLETFMLELAESQFELTFKPAEGLKCPDAIVVMKDGLRAMLGQNALVPTFMTSPTSSEHANGFHLNHSLWKVAGNENAFLDSNDELFLSETVRHWIAGLIHHGQALTALLCPTANCYRRLEDEVVPQRAIWAIENRQAFLRLRTDNKNVYIENRLPSSACNPYLAVAGTLAAGMDGLARKLECPPQISATAAMIPKTMEEAIGLLESDTVLVEALGKDLVSAFADLYKKGFRLRDSQGLDDLNRQREIYFNTI